MSNSSDSATNKFSGVWQSTYVYHSSIRDADIESKHYVRLYPKGDLLIMETIPDKNDSYMLARFNLDGKIATGTWQEGTSPKGDYKGVIYHGAGQLILSDDGKKFTGKWVGFGKKMEIKTGNWQFVYLGEDESVISDRAAGQ
jgi:hypothetical protein